MGQKYRDLNPGIQEFIAKQQLFFVASAPLSSTVRCNLSPKGYNTLRIVSEKKFYYLDLTGSGVETVSHMKVGLHF
jgi:hypothetical protein